VDFELEELSAYRGAGALDPARRRKHPAGQHHRRYGLIALGAGIILAGILFRWNVPFGWILITLGSLSIVGGAIAHAREEPTPARAKHPAGHHRARYGPYVFGVGALAGGALMLVPGLVTFNLDLALYLIGALTLATGVVAYLREE